MSVEISDEAVLALMDDARLEFQMLLAARGIPEHALELLFGMFCEELLEFPHNVVEVFNYPAAGATKHLCAIRLRPTFQLDFALTALDRLGFARH